ncbi:hypothetical protein ACQP1W_44830 [Spirillospora sp. CA-255316]
MTDAVARHRSDRATGHGMLAHRFLCPASRTSELRAELEPSDHIKVVVIADTGEQGLASALVAVADDAALELAGLEYPLAKADQADPIDALNTALKAVPDRAVPLFVEPARLSDTAVLAPAIAEQRQEPLLGLKLRCGGVRADLFPSPDELAHALVDVATAAVALKATAGLHHAVRYTDPETAFTHHGFLNLVAAVADAVAGATPDKVAGTLRTTDPAVLVKRVSGLGTHATAATRQVFTAYGSCSTSTPPYEARKLGLWN